MRRGPLSPLENEPYPCAMWRDLAQYLKALGNQWAHLLTGALASLALLFWGVFAHADIPQRAFWVAAAIAVFVAGFLAWREEHTKVAADGEDDLRDLASSMVDTYVTLAQSHSDAGPHALATLNLPALGSDALIRKTIHRMEQRVGRDPWEGWARFVEDVDLVKFFAWVREHGPNLHIAATNVEEVAKQVTAAGGQRTERQRAADLRITDRVKEVRRQLNASFEESPQGPQTLDELVRWAHRLARGFQWTKPGLRELVDMRAEASHWVQEAVGKARDHYDAAADIINPIIRRGWETWETDPAGSAAATAALRKAVAYVRDCLKELSLGQN